jgi:hypothetical protein
VPVSGFGFDERTHALFRDFELVDVLGEPATPPAAALTAGTLTPRRSRISREVDGFIADGDPQGAIRHLNPRCGPRSMPADLTATTYSPSPTTPRTPYLLWVRPEIRGDRMRQVWITRTGPEVLELREAAGSAPRAGEVQIFVRAIGINFADIMARLGLYPDAPKLPAVVGYEVAGDISALGGGVSRSVGERVFALTRFGGYSDVVCVPSGQAMPLPNGMSYEEGAAIPVNYLTAYQCLCRWSQRAERVLVHSAAGGVGLRPPTLLNLWRRGDWHRFGIEA